MQVEATIRICTSCNKPLPWGERGQTGFLCCDEYYCSQPCLDKSFEKTGTNWEEHYSEASDCYYTDWELEVNDASGA